MSPGCAHCYAETFAERFRGVPGHPYEPGFDLTLRPERLQQPLAWKRPRVIFVNSMSDLFHEGVPDEYVAEVFDVMRRADWHVFQVLTKRPERVRALADRLPWPDNVWMGVSVENQRWTSRIEELRAMPAAVRFLSCEPLLGPLQLDLQGIAWVIVGGESGPGARPMQLSWARSVRDQCAAAGVPFFFKQWGAHDEAGVRRGKKASGRVLDGRTWDELPGSAIRETESGSPADRFAPSSVDSHDDDLFSPLQRHKDLLRRALHDIFTNAVSSRTSSRTSSTIGSVRAREPQRQQEAVAVADSRARRTASSDSDSSVTELGAHSTFHIARFMASKPLGW